MRLVMVEEDFVPWDIPVGYLLQQWYISQAKLSDSVDYRYAWIWHLISVCNDHIHGYCSLATVFVNSTQPQKNFISGTKCILYVTRLVLFMQSAIAYILSYLLCSDHCFIHKWLLLSDPSSAAGETKVWITSVWSMYKTDIRKKQEHLCKLV